MSIGEASVSALSEAGYTDLVISTQPEGQSPSEAALEVLKQSGANGYDRIHIAPRVIDALNAAKTRQDLDLVVLVPFTASGEEVGSYEVSDGLTAKQAVEQHGLVLVEGVNDLTVAHAGSYVTMAAAVHAYNQRKSAAELVDRPLRDGSHLSRTQMRKVARTLQDSVWADIWKDATSL